MGYSGHIRPAKRTRNKLTNKAPQGAKDHMKILTDKQYGSWLAWDENYQPDDNSPTGTGKTEQEAINDYKENKEEQE